MIDRAALLADLQKLLQRLEADLLERSESVEVPDVGRTLRAEYERARTAQRTAQNYEDWRSDAITQAAAAWVLSCVFVRFLEDSRLIDPPKIAGPAERLQRARDEHELYFREHLKQSDRDYLLAVFDQLATLPGTKDVFGEHNPIRELPNWLSGDAAGELLRFFQNIDANSGVLVHDFTDPNWDTRFLGDLYQDLSEAARKKYALLQTPEFVEEFILDRTLEPALDEFGLEGFKMIDPACGSGHFLLGAYRRIENLWERRAPDAKCREVVQGTLDSIFGVDVNPFAVAIARFRLLLAALKTCGEMKLAQAPAFHINLVCGDSLYHGRQRQQMLGDWTDEAHYFAAEDAPRLRQILREGTYHCVVANPPYITPKDRAANEAYRKLYPQTCHMKYSLAVPFMERLFRLAVSGSRTRQSLDEREETAPQSGDIGYGAAGYVGQITANSFMKREFGKKLIESFFPTVDLTHVIDTSGAYIPGHGTPTVILFGRNRAPVSGTIRAVMGIRGEPSTPDDPSRGLVWTAIVRQLDQPGSQSEFVSVGDSPRELFHKHPWSIGGGGAAELKEQLEENATASLSAVADEIGILGMTNADEVMLAPRLAFARKQVEALVVRRLALGDEVRDWRISEGDDSLFPYCDGELISIRAIRGLERWLWPCRTILGNRATFARLTYFQEGRPWWEWHQITLKRLRTPLSIVYGEVATHNHFVLDRGGKVFKQTAPVIKLPKEASEDDHLALLGLLNSSTACFWMKQVCHNKGSTVDQHGARQRTSPFEDFYAFNGTKLQQFPLPAGRPLELAKKIVTFASQHSQFLPSAVTALGAPTRRALDMARFGADMTRAQMITLQEELDWHCYWLYGLTDSPLTRKKARWSAPAGQSLEAAAFAALVGLKLGQRAFEIVLARKMARGELQTTWFERHVSTPITELPAEWPDDYRQLVERRIELIESDPNIRLIEQPEYKRRWNTEPWDTQLERALREWLLDRLESYFDFDGRMNDADRPTAKLDIALVSVAKLADVARQDAEFQQVGELYRDDPAFDVQALVAELVAAESVPLLPVLRYKASGLIKRGTWERTWDLQRQEDAIDARTKLPGTDPQFLSEDAARDLKREQVGDIPVPTKYDSKDFLDSNFWRLRGKLDVPKERWISFPHCEGPDGTAVIAWAGYDHLQQARAISAYYVDIQERLGGRDDPRLVPLLACLLELLPWLKQWHNEVDPEYGMAMGDYFEGFVNEEARQLGKTIPEFKAWTPPKKVSGRGRKKAGT